MTTKTNVSKFVSIYLLICTVLVIGLNLYELFSAHVPITMMSACMAILCCAAAAIYALKGYRKDSAKYYKLFMILLFVFFQLKNCEVGIIGENPAETGSMIGWVSLCAALALVLALSSDLGKKKSMMLCWIMLTVTVAMLVMGMILRPGVVLGGSFMGTAIAIHTASTCFLAQAALVMTVAKYQDKTARGTK